MSNKKIKHYPYTEQTGDYVKRRLHLEAKRTSGQQSVESRKEGNRLAKNKSIFISKMEKQLDVTLKTIEDSRYTKLLEELATRLEKEK